MGILGLFRGLARVPSAHFLAGIPLPSGASRDLLFPRGPWDPQGRPCVRVFVIVRGDHLQEWVGVFALDFTARILC